METVERSDMACAGLLEGRIIIITEGSGIALIVPVTLSSLYVSIVSLKPEILPVDYILTIAKSRATVPFNAFFEAIIMELVSEIIREAIIRLPK